MKVSEAEIARIVNDCVDEILRDGQSVSLMIDRYPEISDLLPDALEAALWMRDQQPEAVAIRQFVIQSKARLLSRLPKRSAAQPVRSERPGWNGFVWLRTVAVAIFLLFLASLTGVVYAAKNSLPGENLYPTKLVIEEWLTNLTQDPEKQISYAIQKMEIRLSEVEALASSSDYANLDRALEAYQNAVQSSVAQIENADLADSQKEILAQKLQERLADHLAHLDTVRSKVPAQAQKGIDRAIEVSTHGLTVAQNAVLGIHIKKTLTATSSSAIGTQDTPTPTITKKNDRPAEENAPSPTQRVKKEPTATPGAPEKTPPGLENKPTQKPKPDHPDNGVTPKPTKTPKK